MGQEILHEKGDTVRSPSDQRQIPGASQHTVGWRAYFCAIGVSAATSRQIWNIEQQDDQPVGQYGLYESTDLEDWA